MTNKAPVQRAAQQPFVSQLLPYALDRIGDDPAASEAGRHPCEAVVMFADVTGFTAWTARLAVADRRGAEQVASRLDRHFEELLDVVGRWGGFVHGFAGDAAIIAWPVDLYADRSQAVAHAIACALEIQSRAGAPKDESVGLMPQRIAVGAGDLVLDRVGGVDGRWHLLVGGPVWDQVIAADEHATVGHVAVSASCLHEVTGMVDAVQVASECWRVERISTDHLVPRRATEPVEAGVLDAFVSVRTIEQLAADHQSWLAEFRRVTAMFVALDGGSSHLPLQSAQDIDLIVQRAIADHEGDLIYFRYDDKGLVGLVVFGTALRSHENDAERALHLAARLHRELPGDPHGIRIGLATGQVFAGLVGGAGYREYTVYGEIVNLAARLMQNAASSTTLCDAATRDAVSEAFDFEALDDIELKGLAVPVTAFRLSEVRTVELRRGVAPLIGRAREVSVLRPLIASVRADSEMRLVNLRGEAGVGKSALIEYTRRVAEGRDMRVAVGAGDSIRRGDPYYAWRRIFAHLLGGHEPASFGHRYFDRWRDDDRAALFGVVLDDAPPDSAFVARLDAAGRADTTREFLVDVLAGLLVDRPAMIVVDDVQWLDSASWQLLELFVRRSVGALVLTASRPLDDNELPSEARRLLRSAASLDLELGPLSRDETDALVADRVGADAVSEELGRQIYERTEGHALFTEQMVLSLSDRGIVRVDAAGVHFAPGRRGLDELNFPDGVESVVTSRIDRLTPAVQLTLKVASVVGRDFSHDLLAGIHPIESSISDLDQHLTELVSARLIERESRGDLVGYRFEHAIIRDAAYGLLISAQQRQLHRDVAEQLERRANGSGSSAALLAHHWSRAEVDERAVHHLDRAGRHALDDHANIEARQFLLDALARSERRPDLADRERRARWYHLLGRAEVNLGEYSEALKHLSEAIASLDAPMPSTAFRTSSGLLRQVGRHIGVRRGKAPPVDDVERALAAADTYSMLAEIHYNNHHLESALYATVTGANLALRSQPASPVAATLHSNLAVAATVAPSWLGQADHYSRVALAIAADVDDPSTWARVLLIVGTYEFGEGRWPEAVEHYERSMVSATEGGERKLFETAAGGLGNVHRMVGRFALADATDRRVWDSGRDRGVAQSQVWGGYGRVSALCSLNRFDDLTEMLDDFGRLLDEPGVRDEVSASNVVAYLATKALLDFHDGHDESGLDAVDEAITEVDGLHSLQSYMCCTASYIHDAVMAAWRRNPTDARVAGWAQALDRFAGRCAKLAPIGGPRAHLTAGDMRMMAGRLPAARRFWRKGLRLADRMDMPFDSAQAHHLLATRAGLSNEECGEHNRESDRILARLGIEQPFAWTV